jgi:hypothetical protein
MFNGLLTDWLTLDGSGATAFIQDRKTWLDLAACADVTLWLEVRSVKNPGAGTVVLSYETAPATDESLFVAMAPGITLAASASPVITKVRLADNPGVPLARFLRWKLNGTAAGSWSLTFRVHAFGGHGTAAGAADPSSLSLTGWWRASYAGSPWTPSASAGSSGSNGDSSGWSSVAAGNIDTTTEAVNLGVDWNLAMFFDGALLEVIFSDTALSDASFDSIKQYTNARYGLAL